MDKISVKVLKATAISTLYHKLPLGVTLDGEVKVVILRVGDYNQLVYQAKGNNEKD